MSSPLPPLHRQTLVWLHLADRRSADAPFHPDPDADAGLVPRGATRGDLERAKAELAALEIALAAASAATTPPVAVPGGARGTRPTPPPTERVAALVAGLTAKRLGDRNKAEKGLVALGSEATNALVAALASPAAKTREAAARVLGRMGAAAQGAAHALVAAVAAPGPLRARKAAAVALTELGTDVLDAVDPLLGSSALPHEVREILFENLATLGEAQAVERRLTRAMDDPDPSIRAMAVSALPALGTGGLGLVARALADASIDVQWPGHHALYAIAERIADNEDRVGAEAVVDLALSRLHHGTGESGEGMREAIGRVLGEVARLSPRVFPVLVAALGADETRELAIAGLMIAPRTVPEAFDPLVEASFHTDPDSYVAYRVHTLLLQIGGPERVLALLDDPRPDRRLAALAALATADDLDEAGGAAAAAALRRTATDPDARVRLAAAETASSVLDEDGDELAREIVVRALADPNPEVVRRAMSTYGELWALQDASDVKAALGALLEHAERDIRSRAALALSDDDAPDPRRASLLVEALDDRDPEIVDAAQLELGCTGGLDLATFGALLDTVARPASSGPAAAVLEDLPRPTGATLDALVAALARPEAARRRWAAFLLGRAKGDEPATVAAAALIRAVTDSDLSVRRAAVLGLGRLPVGTGGVADALVDCLASTDPGIRQLAATGLGRRATKAARAAAPLAQCLAHDPSLFVRLAAAEAIGRFARKKPALALELGRALADPEPRVRAAAAAALGEVGPEATGVDEALARAASDTAPEVARLATAVLAQRAKGARRVKGAGTRGSGRRTTEEE